MAQAAERLEQAAGKRGDETAMRAAIAELEAASFEARVGDRAALGEAGGATRRRARLGATTIALISVIAAPIALARRGVSR